MFHLRIYDKDESPCATEYHLVVECGVEEINLTRKVPDLEADKGTVGNVLSANLIGAFQEQSLIGWHLVENNFLNGRFAAAPQAHEQDPRFHLTAERVTEAQHCKTAKTRKQRFRIHAAEKNVGHIWLMVNQKQGSNETASHAKYSFIEHKHKRVSSPKNEIFLL